MAADFGLGAGGASADMEMTFSPRSNTKPRVLFSSFISEAEDKEIVRVLRTNASKKENSLVHQKEKKKTKTKTTEGRNWLTFLGSDDAVLLTIPEDDVHVLVESHEGPDQSSGVLDGDLHLPVYILEHLATFALRGGCSEGFEFNSKTMNEAISLSLSSYHL